MGINRGHANLTGVYGRPPPRRLIRDAASLLVTILVGDGDVLSTMCHTTMRSASHSAHSTYIDLGYTVDDRKKIMIAVYYD
jgi:hypothetical protein